MSGVRLIATTRPVTPCIPWTGKVCPKGYGLVWSGNRYVRAHRVSYEKAKGPIPAGLVIDHLCRNRSCTNPDHLEAVTDEVNIMRGDGLAPRFAARTHCGHGHEFTADNIKWRYSGKYKIRRCLQCWRADKRAWQARKKARKLTEASHAK